jgi:mono/diheme cytochrome c family protein
MNKVLKILLWILIVVVIGIGGLLSYLKFGLPKVADAPDLRIEITPERLERGEYLAWYVSGCIECHSQRDWTTFSGPVIPGTEGAGGHPFTRAMGLPGQYYPPNITPAGLEDWTDGEIFRAVTAGVSRDGRSLFPVMPYHYYGKMDREDIYSIITYIRTLDPIESDIPEAETDFPMNIIINLMPQEPEFTSLPDTSDWLAYGHYMANAGGCIHCHTTQDDRGMLIPEMWFAGGNEYFLPSGDIVRSANLTPDEETGIGRWTEEAWVARLTAFAYSSARLPKVGPGDFNSVMSWELHGKMHKQDLRAIYRYIRTLEPISHRVERFTPKK